MGYDIIADWWFETKERLNNGIVYSEGWYDADYIMITKNREKGSQLEMWAILKPFTSGVWIMTFITLLISGLLYYFLDFMSHVTNNVEMETKMGESVFYSFLTSTGHCNYTPTDTSNRIFAFSLTFLFLVIASAYTANLAAFMVNDNTSMTINTFQDVVDQKLPVCITNKISKSERLQKDYPHANYVVVETEREAFNLLNSGRCDITLTAYESFNGFKKSAEYNPNCNLYWVGRAVYHSMASFAIKDRKKYCRSIFRDVIDIHLKEMKNDGALQKIWEDQRKLTMDKCSHADQSLDKNEKLHSLSLMNMGGVFLIHLIISIGAIVIAIVKYKTSPEHTTGTLSSAVNTRMKKIFNRRTKKDNQDIFDETKEEYLESRKYNGRDLGPLEDKMQLMFLNFKDEMLAQIREEIKDSQNEDK